MDTPKLPDMWQWYRYGLIPQSQREEPVVNQRVGCLGLFHHPLTSTTSHGRPAAGSRWKIKTGVFSVLRRLTVHDITRAHLLDIPGKVERRDSLSVAEKLRTRFTPIVHRRHGGCFWACGSFRRSRSSSASC